MILVQHQKHAFSLLELIVTLAIIATVILFSAHSFADYFKSRTQRLFMQQLYHDLKWARIEAIVLGVIVSVQPYNHHLQVVSHNWCDGWVIFKNSDEAGLQYSGQVLKVQSELKECDMTAAHFGDWPYLSFLPQGTTYQNGTLSFYEHSVVTMQIVVSKAGHVRWIA